MQRNTQPPEKPVRASRTLAVNSIFPTLQGEGPYVGTPATFVRLAGCNLQCPLCDTEYTTREAMTVTAIIEAATCLAPSLQRKPLVVLTGGEPFRQPITPLVCEMLDKGWRVQIETNGTLYRDLPFSHPHLTIVCSPKASKVNGKLQPHIKAYKYVATAAALVASPDGLPDSALEHPNAKGLFRPPVDSVAEVYLQPVDEQDPKRNRANQDAVINSCLRHGYRLCLQTHKIINLP